MSLPPRLAAALPRAREIELGDRGVITVWDSGPGAATTLLLLHGWNVDSGLNFASALPALTSDFRVVMADLHGHGSGPRDAQPFSLESCATDALALTDQLGIERFVSVGYSLGGAIAQVLARQAPGRCVGLVLAASTATYNDTRAEAAQFRALRLADHAMRRAPIRIRQRAFDRIVAWTCRQYPDWVAGVVRTADPVALLQAGVELGRFDSRPWLAEIDQPTTVVVTGRDMIVDPYRQRHLGRALPNATIIDLDAGHDIPVLDDPRYAAALQEAATQVVARLAERAQAPE